MRTQVTRAGRLSRILATTAFMLACSDPRPDHDDAAIDLPASATPMAAAVALGATPLALDPHGIPRLLQARGVAPAPAATAIES
ncbi:MAG: hypothetical protein M3680_22515, partial [Myxococcota bacterium]|nr:hypothetical protein [Myxococcota bacterium]